MGYRKFTDRDGNVWEVRDVSRNEWDFEPIAGNRQPRRTVSAPGYEKDAFELSVEELQRLFDAGQPARSRKKGSPFLD